MNKEKLQAEIAQLPFSLEDVEKYQQYHETYQNGTKIRAVIKKELCTFQSDYHPDRDEFGFVRKKYGLNETFQILGKEFPLFRKHIMKLIKEQGEFKSTTHGINAGTPIAQSWTFKRKELPGESILQVEVK